MLKDQENSIKAFKKGFQLPKVKSPQKKKEEKEMKYTLAFHAEGKKNEKLSHVYYLVSCHRALAGDD